MLINEDGRCGVGVVSPSIISTVHRQAVVKERRADDSVTPGCRPVQARATIRVTQVNRRPRMTQKHHNLGVTPLARPEEGGVSVGVHCVEVGRVLEKELDTVSVTREGSCMQGCKKKEKSSDASPSPSPLVVGNLGLG